MLQQLDKSFHAFKVTRRNLLRGTDAEGLKKASRTNALLLRTALCTDGIAGANGRA